MSQRPRARHGAWSQFPQNVFVRPEFPVRPIDLRPPRRIISRDSLGQMFGRDGGFAERDAQRVHFWIVADFHSRSGREKSTNRNVFVDVVPVNSHAPADKPPVGALFGRSAKKAREPRQGSGYAAAIDERDDQLVIGALNIDSVRDRFTG
jgi:hypothetical protein